MELDLDAIDAAEKAMTKGPWEVIGSHEADDDGDFFLPDSVKAGKTTVVEVDGWDGDNINADLDGIAILRNAAPDLTRRIREQEATIAELRALCGRSIELVRFGLDHPGVDDPNGYDVLRDLESASKGGES